MLVLDRGRNQQIVIEDTNNPENRIVLKILRVGCTHAKIGIQAPAHILVYRPEIGNKEFWLDKKKTKETTSQDENKDNEASG